MQGHSLKTLADVILPHLSGIAGLLLLARGPEGWQTAESRVYEADVALQPPDDTVLDFAAAAGRPTYLPQGDEGSDFCLLDARSTLYFPLPGGQRLLYVLAQSSEAFTGESVEAAWRSLGELSGP